MATGLIGLNINIHYEDEISKIKDFLQNFKANDQGPFKYIEIMKKIVISSEPVNDLIIDLEDIKKFENSESGLIQSVLNNTKTYIELFSFVIDQLVPLHSALENDDFSVHNTVAQTLINQRISRDRIRSGEEHMFPSELLRKYYLTFAPLKTPAILHVRELKAKNIGKYISFKAIVTKTAEVRPLLLVCAYSCDLCGCEIFQEVKKRQFLPMAVCPSKECQSNQTKGKLHMLTRACKFVRYQEIKAQELAENVPEGHTPRTISVHAYETLTRKLNPGDIVTLSGIFLPLPYVGYKALKAGLLSDTYVQLEHIENSKIRLASLTLEENASIEDQINSLRHNPNRYEILSSSIAPEIFGHSDIKKALLLLMIGGGTRTTADGMVIRGDINICLMGDPGVAKSQLLKFVSKTATRAVYTSGKGSSGVGLTAAVVRDPLTEELMLEGGALVLADNGICCIDEFDKMNESDRTSIHEVMEQQTISISKAGINTTLNARTAILAAANPLYGRYNSSKSVQENINLPAALLSRFDIMFLVLDVPDINKDGMLADHVTHVHMHSTHPDQNNDATATVSPKILREYISYVKRIEVKISPAVVEIIVNAYVELRKANAPILFQKDAGQIDDDLINNRKVLRNKHSRYISPRCLLAIIRLSMALARIRFSEEVEHEDVEEALRLIDSSRHSLQSLGKNRAKEVVTADTVIFRIIREMRREVVESTADKHVAIEYKRIAEKVRSMGHTKDELEACISKYQTLNMWVLNPEKTTLSFIQN